MEPADWETDAVLSDGTPVHLRLATPGDRDATTALYRHLSDHGRRMRFFTATTPERAAEFEHLERLDGRTHVAVVAERDGDVVAIARYDRVEDDSAEVAFAVADALQGRGLGSLLLEHLAAVARGNGLHRFTAVTLSGNARMLGVFLHAGFAVSRHPDSAGTIELEFAIDPTAASLRAQHEREHTAEARSMSRLLAPATVAVVGAGRDPAHLGHRVLRNLLDGGFAGRVFPVNHRADRVAGLPAWPSVDAIPVPVDLAVVAVPAPAVLEVAGACGRAGVHGLVVLSAGFAELGEGGAAEHELVHLARSHGMRVVGPNCMGVANTDPGVRLHATFAPVAPRPGRVGVASQSGGVGIVLLDPQGPLRTGVSTFVSLGNKADVSGNDLLQYWRDDPATDVVVLYLESFGNPRKFARVAADVARRKPVVALKAGRTPAGARAASSHTAALATPERAVDALFAASGVLRVGTVEELVDATEILAGQPPAAGPRVGIVSNGGGPGILTADACSEAGLEVPVLAAPTQEALRAVLPPEASTTNPVDLVASAGAQEVETALGAVLDDDGVDSAVVVYVQATAADPAEVGAAVARAAARRPAKPVAACFLGPAPRGSLGYDHDGTRRTIPVYDYPERAVAALAAGARRAAWLRRPVGTVPDLPGVDADAARGIVAGLLAGDAAATWLDAPTAGRLLACFGIPALPATLVPDADAAVAAAERFGFPVALKVGSPAVVHKSDVGGVRLGLSSAADVRDAFAAVHRTLGDAMGGAVVQPMAAPGVETIVGVHRDPRFGALVLFGAGGVTAELQGDSVVRLAPLTDVDAHEVVGALRASPLLTGFRGAPPVDLAALEDLLLRAGLLADALPEVAELDANPVVCTPAGAVVVDVRVRLAPQAPWLPRGLRAMRPA